MKIDILVLQRSIANEYSFNRLYIDPIRRVLSSNVEKINQAKVFYPDGAKKVSAKDKKEWLEHVKDKLDNFDIILCSDGDYFKTLAGTSKAEGTIGMIYDSNYTSAKILYIPSVTACNFHPDKNLPKIDITIESLDKFTKNQYEVIGSNIIHSFNHPKTVQEIQQALEQLHQYPMLSLDIEAKSLKFSEAGIYTIGFAWDKHNYICFPVDASDNPIEVRQLLKDFIVNYKGKFIIHKSNYDITVLNYVLFQEEDLGNIKGQVEGLNTFFGSDNQRIEDTLIITYLATNSCAGNTLGLKELASEFAGDWAVDVKDVTKVNLDDLLTYNGIDCLSTWYVYEKYYPIMVQDEQEDLYKSFMLETLKNNIRCQLNGLPIEPRAVKKFSQELNQEREQLLTKLLSYKEISEAQYLIAEETTKNRNSKLKTKVTTIEDNLQDFNFGSNKQLAVLVYEVMGLPVIETTPTKEPACGKKVFQKLINHTENQTYKDILQALCDLADVDKIQSAFIPAFENPSCTIDFCRLTGFFNLGGTVSGRLSSSQINLQQLPSTGSRFAKPVKKLFKSTEEWVFCGIDFASLEDYIDALQTKDPNKLKVYLDGYDGHSLRARYYFANELSDIDINDVEAVNNIAKTHKHLRQASKAPTFALTYDGTYITLMQNCGFDEATAKSIEFAYHDMYKVSGMWKAEKIKQACKDGYVTVGFGLKVRTPILKNTIYSDSMSNLAKAEARTAGNALGQGWGVLNDRAMNEVIERIDKEGYTESILPVAKVHDAGYYLVKNDIDTILWLNQAVVKASKWQDHPDIQHDSVHLHGNLDLFYPDWSNPITLPDDCTEEQLLELCKDYSLNENS